MACKTKAAQASPDFRLLFEALPGACLALAPDLTVVAATNEACHVLGVERATMLSSHIDAVFPPCPGKPDARRETLTRIGTQNKPKAIDLHREGRAFHCIATPVGSMNTQFQYILLQLDSAAHAGTPEPTSILAGIFLDETDDATLLTPNTLKRKRVNDMLMHLPIAIAVLRGPDMVYEFANPRYNQLVGSGRELIGLPLLTAVPDVAQPILDILKGVLTTGERFIGDEYPITLDWDYNDRPYRKYLNFIYEPLYDANEHVDGILVFAYDVDTQVLARQRMALLADASVALSSLLDYKATLQAVARLTVPTLADTCFFDVLGDDGALHRIGATVASSEVALVLSAQRFVPTLADTNHPVIQALTSGTTILANDIDDTWLQKSALDEDHLAYLRTVNLHAMLSVPVIARDRTIGVLTLSLCDISRRYFPDDQALVEDLAGRAALAIENARLFTAEQQSRVEAERRLAELTAVINSMTDAVYIGGPNGMTMCNGPALSQLGFTKLEDLNHEVAYLAEQIKTRNAATGERIPPGRESFVIALGGQPDISEIIVRHQQTGEDRVVRCAAAPVRLNGEIIGAVAVNTDITERKLAERERVALLKREQAARAEAEAAVRAREDFLSVAAHELKTPLTSLRGFSEVLLRQFAGDRSTNPARVRESVDAIYQQSLKLSRFVEQLLDMTRIASGKLKLDPQATDIGILVRTIVANLQPLAGQHTFDVNVCSEIIAIVDPLRIEQVVINLLMNAIKFSPDDQPITVCVELASGVQLRIIVVDRGAGIAPEYRAHIFDLFYQAPLSGASGGLGLGLAVSQSIVHLHGGTIVAEFPAEGGTRMVVTLPSVPHTS